MNLVADTLQGNRKILDGCRTEWKLLHHEIIPLAKFFGGKEFNDTLTNVREFCNLCDRIERFRANGTLELLTSFGISPKIPLTPSNTLDTLPTP